MDMLHSVQLSGTDNADSFCWIFERTGVYTTRSMYRNIMFRGVNNRRMEKLLKSKIPMKIKVFMWMLIQDKLQNGVNLTGDTILVQTKTSPHHRQTLRSLVLGNFC